MNEKSPIIILDGIQCQLTNPDIDGDGNNRGIENIKIHSHLESNSVAHITQPSEIGEALEKLDEDTIDPETKMSKIDLNANLNVIEKNSYGVLDFLVSISFLPENVLFLPRQFKRLSVSVGGVGRQQKVNMVTGQREHERGIGGSLMDKAKGLFGMGDKE